MGIMVDTCVFIHSERQQHIKLNQLLPEENVFISAITASELLMGIHLADSKARRMKRTAFVEAILASVPILDFSLEVARLHAELYAELTSKGKLIGAHDLIIAATALSHGYSLLTSNEKEFKRIPGLKVLSPNYEMA